MGTWPQRLLPEVVTFQEGPGILAKDFRDDGIPLVRLSGLGGYAVTLDGCNYVSEEKGTTKWNHFRLVMGDILISTSASFGRPAIVGDEAAGAIFYTGIIRFRSSSSLLDEAYLKLFLGSRAFSLQANAVASGSVIQHYGPSHLKQMTIDLPPLPVQRHIAGVIAALDDKIELNRRMNETLEASARALFQDWFVDFGPTRAKAEGSPAYLAPDLWSLFPDRLGDDGVPVGWRTGVLGNIIDVSPPEPLKRGVLAPYLDMAALPTSGPNAQPAVQREYASGTRFRNGDTLLARITPCLENGKTAFVQALPENTVGWGSTEFIVLRAIWPVPECVPYLIARDDDFRRHAIQSMTGTSGRQRASADAVTRYPIALPPDDRLWRCLSPALEATFERIARNAQVSQALAKTRDGLLPKLMSGELCIRGAEALAA